MGILELLQAAQKVVVEDKEMEELRARLQAAEEAYEEENFARSASQEFMSRVYCL